MTSLSARLSTVLLVTCLALFLVGGFGLRASFRRSLRSEFDHALEAKARALVTLTKEQGGEIEIDFADEFMPEFEAEENPWFFQIWLPSGEVLERSRALQRLVRDNRPVDLKRGQWSPMPRFSDVALPDRRQGRQVQIDFMPQDEDEEDALPGEPRESLAAAGRTVTLVTARSRDSLEHQFLRLDRQLIVFGVALVAGLVAIAYLGVPLLLRPLRNMAQEFSTLDEDNLDRRLSVDGVPRELTDIVNGANGVLKRLEAAFARERRLSDNLAHELRTPISELQSLAGVAQRWPEDREGVREFFSDVRQIAEQMGTLVSGLLGLARLESGTGVTRAQSVPLLELVDSVHVRLRGRATDRNLLWSIDVAKELALRTDPQHLDVIVTNLIENAVAHSPARAVIEVVAGRSGRSVYLSVRNPAPDLKPEDLGQLCERFWRKSGSRADRDHSGLGLALVRELCRALDFGFSIALDKERHLILRIGQEQNA